MLYLYSYSKSRKDSKLKLKIKMKPKKILKSIIASTLALSLLAISITACSKEEINGIDPKTPVANMENPPDGAEEHFTVNYSDFYSEYSFYLARSGYTEEENAEEALAQRDNVIRYLTQERVILYLAEQAGITESTLSADDLQAIDDTVQTSIDNWCDSYRSDAVSELGETYTEEELRNKEMELFTAFLAESGLTADSFRVWEVNGRIRDKYVEYVSDTIGDETVENFVQDTVDQAKDKYENDLATFETSYTAFYMPEGSRLVQQILVKIDETSANEITAYRKDGDDAKADALLEEALAKIKPKIDEAYQKLENGESWASVQAEYNDESDTNGVDYTLYPKSTTVNPAVIEAAMAIGEAGHYSPVCESDSGYFIIYYTAPAEFSQERLDDLNRQAREFLANEEAYNKITEFEKEHPYSYDYELLNLDEGSLESTSAVQAE